MRTIMLNACAVIVAATILVTSLPGQCSTTWLPGMSVPGADGAVAAVTNWDPDGTGPLPTMTVAAGSFTVMGDVAASRVAMMDPTTEVWSPIGTPGTVGDILALAVLPNGTLVAGGSFSQIGGVAASNVAQFANGSWQPIGPGIAGPVYALQVMPTGQLVAGGNFYSSPGGPQGLAQWNGTSWSPVGTGVQGGLPIVYALALDAAGNLFAGGRFDTAGFALANGIARWNGTIWSSVGGGVSFTPGSGIATVQTLTSLPSGELLVGGVFNVAGGMPAAGLAGWNGISWSSIGVAGGSLPQVAASSLAANGDLLIAGHFTSVAGVTANGAARRNATTGAWTSLAASPRGGSAIAETSTGSIFLGGWFREPGPPELVNAALWDGAAWNSLAPAGFAGQVERALTLLNGNLVIGGSFQGVGGTSANGIAQWDGVSWTGFAQGSIGSVLDLIEMPNGDLVASGSFADANGQVVPGIARWNGVSWEALGAGLEMIGGQFPIATELAVLANGNLIAVGYFRFAGAVHGVLRWNGAVWSAVGSWPPLSAPSAMHELPNGDLVVSGKDANGHAVVRLWDGNVWTQLGGSFGSSPGIYNIIRHIDVNVDGDLIVGGYFTVGGGAPADNMARWDGAAWHPIGSGVGFVVLDTLVMPNGDLFAVGEVNGAAFAPVARFDGNAWTAVNSAGTTIDPYSIKDIELLPNGDVQLAGVFSTMGGQVSSGLATLRSTCPAAVVVSGAGCVGSGGLNELRATSLPWIGSTFTSQALGLQPNGLAVSVLGLTTIAQPLPSVLPQALVGCSLLVTPAVLGLEVNAGTGLTVSLPLPNTPLLISQQMHQQIVPFAFGAAGSIAAVTSTNRLTMTFGVF